MQPVTHMEGRRIKSCFSSFPTHIFPAGAWKDASNIPGKKYVFLFLMEAVKPRTELPS